MNINYVKDKKSFLLQYILVVFDLILPHYYQSLSFSLILLFLYPFPFLSILFVSFYHILLSPFLPLYPLIFACALTEFHSL